MLSLFLAAADSYSEYKDSIIILNEADIFPNSVQVENSRIRAHNRAPILITLDGNDIATSFADFPSLRLGKYTIRCIAFNKGRFQAEDVEI